MVRGQLCILLQEIFYCIKNASRSVLTQTKAEEKSDLDSHTLQKSSTGSRVEGKASGESREEREKALVAACFP